LGISSALELLRATIDGTQFPPPILTSLRWLCALARRSSHLSFPARRQVIRGLQLIVQWTTGGDRPRPLTVCIDMGPVAMTKTSVSLGPTRLLIRLPPNALALQRQLALARFLPSNLEVTIEMEPSRATAHSLGAGTLNLSHKRVLLVVASLWPKLYYGDFLRAHSGFGHGEFVSLTRDHFSCAPWYLCSTGAASPYCASLHSLPMNGISGLRIS